MGEILEQGCQTGTRKGRVLEEGDGGNNKKEDKWINTCHVGILCQGCKLAIAACQE